MITTKLSRIKAVELRNAWEHEAHDFTHWLAEDDNLNLLAEELQIEFHLVQIEANVGKFSVDILAEEDNTGHKIIIENQLEPTNHDHLGKIITYASGVDAQTIVWIVKEAREEHIRAVDWLNEHLDEDINIFLVKIELWQIGDSDYAPKFQIISEPNDWAKVIKQSANTQNGLSETGVRKVEFWSAFKEYATSQGTKLSLRSPKPRHWYDISIGTSKGHISLTVNSRNNQLGCELYIWSDKDLFYALESRKQEIEVELGYPLTWMPLENKKACRIGIFHTVDDVSDTEKWNDHHKWLLEKSEQFHKIFPKEINMANHSKG
jgi:hypothetical protein